MIENIFRILEMPGYIEKKTIKIEISKEELLELIREKKIRVRADGYVEVIEPTFLNQYGTPANRF